MPKTQTILQSLGRNPKKHERCVNTPIYRTSTFIYSSVEEFFENDIPHTDTTYARSGTETSLQLEDAISELEGADHTLVTASGMSALAIAITANLRVGDHALFPDAMYKCTRRFVEEELEKQGISYSYYPANIENDIQKYCTDSTKLIFIESPSSGTFEVCDIDHITNYAKEHNITTILDNTWATPLFYRGLEHNVDIVVQSLTKYIGGHADFIMGAISCNTAAYEKLRKTFRNYGPTTTADNCYLALRGLRTLYTRVHGQSNSAMHVAKWLEKQNFVSQVLYPALENNKSHKLWKKQFSGATSTFGVIFNYDNFKIFYSKINKLKLFSIGLSWGGFESLIVPYQLNYCDTTSKRFENAKFCARFSIGLESYLDIIEDLKQAFTDET